MSVACMKQLFWPYRDSAMAESFLHILEKRPDKVGTHYTLQEQLQNRAMMHRPSGKGRQG